MAPISPWSAAAAASLAAIDLTEIYKKTNQAFSIVVHLNRDSLLISTNWAKSGQVAFRAAFSPGDELKVVKTIKTQDGIDLYLSAVIGTIKVKIALIETEHTILRYTTSLKPNIDLTIPFWPKDMIIIDKNGHPEKTNGTVYTSQVGTRSGLIYMGIKRPKVGAMLYFQNLTALNDYCQQTGTSAGGTVGGQWPELGFTLPATKDKPLAAGKEVVIGDAFVCFDPEMPANKPAMVEQYLRMLSDIYLQLPKPETTYQDWPKILKKGLHDLIESPGCWSQVKGKAYVNAYACDHATPPEIMVQLAVLLPLIDYVEWSKESVNIVNKIKENLPTFYDSNLHTIMRWLPAAEDRLEGEEEQKKPKVMDSWYLHHPLLNLSRMALKGDKSCEKLFLDSLGYAIKVARHFKYTWPVFYNMDNLAVIKAETAPKKGGEKDVAGLYAHIMLQAWELTGKKQYLEEAKKAALTLKGIGFDLFYQANNTAFSAGAMLRLWKITKDKAFLDLSYLCLANIFKNVQLWECDYGYGKNVPTFFALFPLNDAPYTAAYEEQEVFCALHDYLKHAAGEEILPAVTLLTTEYIRNMVNRAVYYYPPMLPKEMLEEKPKIGALDRELWIALEDIHDGWEKSGSVGQEVYGAGNAFGVLPRHYLTIPDEDFMIYADYPVSKFSIKKGNSVSFKITGDERLACRLMIIKQDKGKLPAFTVQIKGAKEHLTGTLRKDGHLEFKVNGNSSIVINWK